MSLLEEVITNCEPITEETRMPEASTTITPFLCCRNAAEAVEFYQKAFGAETKVVFPRPDGKVMYSNLSIQGATFVVCDEFPEHGALGPQSLGGSPVTLHLYVQDCDAAFDHALSAGCQVGMPLQDMFWGDRFGVVVDPYGHKWSIATNMRQVSTEELRQIVSGMAMGNGDGCPAARA